MKNFKNALEAMDRPDLHLFLKVISENPEVLSQQDESGWSLLFHAISRGNTRVCIELIDRGVDINKKDSGGSTPLIEACLRGYTESAKIFLDAGADIEAVNNNGETPLSSAIAWGHVSIIRLLIAYNVEVSKTDNFGFCPILSSVCQNQIDITEELIDAGADLNRSDGKGKTFIEYAFESGNLQLIELAVKDQNFQGLEKGKYEVVRNIEKGRRIMIDDLMKKLL